LVTSSKIFRRCIKRQLSLERAVNENEGKAKAMAKEQGKRAREEEI